MVVLPYSLRLSQFHDQFPLTLFLFFLTKKQEPLHSTRCTKFRFGMVLFLPEMEIWIQAITIYDLVFPPAELGIQCETARRRNDGFLNDWGRGVITVMSHEHHKILVALPKIILIVLRNQKHKIKATRKQPYKILTRVKLPPISKVWR